MKFEKDMRSEGIYTTSLEKVCQRMETKNKDFSSVGVSFEGFESNSSEVSKLVFLVFCIQKHRGTTCPLISFLLQRNTQNSLFHAPWRVVASLLLFLAYNQTYAQAPVALHA